LFLSYCSIKKIMKFLNIKTYSSALFFVIMLLMVSSCGDDNGELPITNDLRVLQVKIGNNLITSGAIDISVIPEIELVFSHGLNASTFENALTFTPAVDFSVTYDNSNSLATVSFNTPLSYGTDYTINLPTGTYGAGGETSVEAFIFAFTTAAFEPPSVTLSADITSFFEGQTVAVIATLNRAVLQDVTMDLAFGGSAIGSGTDYAVSGINLNIPSGATADTITLTANVDGELEGEESIIITLQNLVNAVDEPTQELTLTLGDQPPALEIRGVMELENFIGGSSGRVRAVHLHVLEDIADLSIYGVEIASNGAAPDPMDIDFIFPAGSATAGEDLFIVRDADEPDAAAFFGSCYSNFTIFSTAAMSQNGDDAVLLYNSGVAIESFGEPGVDGTGEYWEYTNSWAYKLGEDWIYAGSNCVDNAGATNDVSTCKYPFCVPLQLQGVSALVWSASGTNGGKFVHVRANQDIADLSQYGIGIANNGGGTDGVEFSFPSVSVAAGEHILIAREPSTIAAYLGSCYNNFAQVFQSDAVSQNGDDAIELFDGTTVIETYGDANVDGTGESWEYSGSWSYKIGDWIYGGIDCAAGSNDTQSSPCPYPLCD
jgi:hypothetical protein